MDSANGWTPRERVLAGLSAASLAISVFVGLLALGGDVSHAGPDKIRSGDIASNAIKSRHVAKNAIKSIDVRNGTLGARDLTVYAVQGSGAPVPSGDFNADNAACKAQNDQVLGGGGFIAGGGQGFVITSTEPDNTNTGWQWELGAQNDSGSDGSVQAYAICLQG
jgi:hypothetical protein